MSRLIPGQAVVLNQSSNLGLVIYEIFTEVGNGKGCVLSLGLLVHDGGGFEVRPEFVFQPCQILALPWLCSDNNTPCRLEIIDVNCAYPLLRMLHKYSKKRRCLQNHKRYSPVLLNVRGSCVTVLSEIVQHIHFSPADIMTRNTKYS